MFFKCTQSIQVGNVVAEPRIGARQVHRVVCPPFPSGFCLVAMEASSALTFLYPPSGSRWVGRANHSSTACRAIPCQGRGGKKPDANDAAAICEAPPARIVHFVATQDRSQTGKACFAFIHRLRAGFKEERTPAQSDPACWLVGVVLSTDRYRPCASGLARSSKRHTRSPALGAWSFHAHADYHWREPRRPVGRCEPAHPGPSARIRTGPACSAANSHRPPSTSPRRAERPV